MYTYDANGNVGQVVDLAAASAATSIKVKYEYGPYGSRVNTPAQDEYEQPFRFSTKQWDDETGLGYWGYRYYSPVLGRWMSRDPIEEDGGLHLHGYARNGPAHGIDRLGLQSVPLGVAQAAAMGWTAADIAATFSIHLQLPRQPSPLQPSQQLSARLRHKLTRSFGPFQCHRRTRRSTAHARRSTTPP